MENRQALHFEVKITEKDMFFFMLNHVYSKTTSYLTLGFSVVCLILFPFSLGWNDIFMSGVLLFGGLLYTVFAQLLVWLQAKRQVKLNPVFKHPIIYDIGSKSLQVTQGENTAEFDWENLSKIVEKKRSFLFYISRNQAFILPKDQIEVDEIESIRDILEKASKESNVKIKLRKNESEDKTA